mmetsp:Transcript_56235/g.159625  ORF Transcript_56235/g.159625 Transcript_56235/m.159625 type:complete len:206 (+) Transcript_56235:1093-1710(+)
MILLFLARLAMLSRRCFATPTLEPMFLTFPWLRPMVSRCCRRSLITSMPICSASSACLRASSRRPVELCSCSVAPSMRSRSCIDLPSTVPAPSAPSRAALVAASLAAPMALRRSPRPPRYSRSVGSSAERWSVGSVRASMSICRSACSASPTCRSAPERLCRLSAVPASSPRSSTLSMLSKSLLRSLSYSRKRSDTVTAISRIAP